MRNTGTQYFMHIFGIVFALLALISWGFGDFLIQKSTRKFGDWIALFYIATLGSAILFPFVLNDISQLISTGNGILVLLAASVLVLVAALFEFEAFRIGKLSAIEPILAFEVPITVGLATYVIRENLGFLQTILVVTLMMGIVLVSIKSFHHLKSISLEAGILYAALGTLAMGFVNFLFAVGARATSPLLINWFTSIFIAFATLVYLASTKQLSLIADDFKKNKKLIFWVSSMDNLAWVAYSYSATYIPIAIATSVSEAYIALAAILGVVFNKEKLQRHQVFGVILAVLSVVVLSAVTAE